MLQRAGAIDSGKISTHVVENLRLRLSLRMAGIDGDEMEASWIWISPYAVHISWSWSWLDGRTTVLSLSVVAQAIQKLCASGEGTLLQRHLCNPIGPAASIGGVWWWSLTIRVLGNPRTSTH
jgi:hypothetical protein